MNIKSRLRRLRYSDSIRNLTEENRLHANDFIYPIFIKEGLKEKQEIKSMPGIFQHTKTSFIQEVNTAMELGIQGVLLFGIPKNKDDTGSESWNENGIVQKAIKLIKKNVPQILCIADACFCEYTSHGHCGVIKNNYLDNDLSLENLKKLSLSYAEAGIDMIAPSGMLDGAVKAIRETLDNKGFYNTSIMAYSAKYCSSFYGPFRDAAESPPKFGNRNTYQMNCANSKEAIEEMKLDHEEGADILMVKPALSYLDIIKTASLNFNTPIAGYNVSGEYSMVKAGGKAGWINEKKIRDEILLSIKRAGADIIISYHALEWAKDNRN